jgi:hypothetical protein
MIVALATTQGSPLLSQASARPFRAQKSGLKLDTGRSASSGTVRRDNLRIGKQTAGMQTLSQERFSPATISAPSALRQACGPASVPVTSLCMTPASSATLVIDAMNGHPVEVDRIMSQPRRRLAADCNEDLVA